MNLLPNEYTADRKTVVITPIKNESWILREFLAAASIYADNIIVSDQHSSDKSVEIAKSFPKVIVIKNESLVYNELDRQQRLLEEARKLGENNLIIALDADEFISPNFFLEGHLDKVKSLAPGTSVEVELANLLPDYLRYWAVKLQPVMFIDDGSANQDMSTMHCRRLPTGGATLNVKLDEVKVMHFQFIDWKRMLSKHRWYQMHERVNFPKKSSLEIFRTYHHMFSIRKSMLRLVPQSWFFDYKTAGVDILNLPKNLASYWWDESSRALLSAHGSGLFKMLDVWEDDFPNRPTLSRRQRLLFAYLKGTQKYINLSSPTPLALIIYAVDKVMRYLAP
jgi:glycosyltransferase involved in cell wall biosynthesis